MYIYTSSVDSLTSHPTNNATSFTSILSQPLHVRSHYIGLTEISITPKPVAAKTGDKNGAAVDDSSCTRDSSGYIYVMLPQCDTSESHGHRYPILRMVALSEFTSTNPIIRFPDTVYIPLKEYNLSAITVLLADAPDAKSGCCIATSHVTGITRCTFHVRSHV